MSPKARTLQTSFALYDAFSRQPSVVSWFSGVRPLVTCQHKEEPAVRLASAQSVVLQGEGDEEGIALGGAFTISARVCVPLPDGDIFQGLIVSVRRGLSDSIQEPGCVLGCTVPMRSDLYKNSVSGPTHHEGMLECKCGHATGKLSFPLDTGIIHRMGVCKWACCGASWEKSKCSQTKTSSYPLQVDTAVSYPGASSPPSEWLLPRLAVSSQVMLYVIPCNDHEDPLYLGDDGKTVYCGQKMKVKKSGSDGVCGPNNGPQCKSCQRATFKLAPGDALVPGHVIPVTSSLPPRFDRYILLFPTYACACCSAKWGA